MIVAGTTPANASQLSAEASQQVDALFADDASHDSPGFVVGVVRDGEVLLTRAYGMANLEWGQPMTADSAFHVGSVSKQITAMAVLLLEAEGLVSLDDDVRKYVPEFRVSAQTVTLRHLLQHVAGVRDSLYLLALAGTDLTDVATQSQAWRVVARQEQLNFSAGSEWAYSNGGYVLLAEIVSRVSQAPFPEFCERRIFSPLQMRSARIPESAAEIIPKRAESYESSGGHFQRSLLNSSIHGSSGLVCTASDLLAWLDNFRTRRVGGEAAALQLVKPAQLSDGTTVQYGLGLQLSRYRGLPTLGHDGGEAGYRCAVLWIAQLNLGVVVLSNNIVADSKLRALQIADAVAGAEFPEAPPRHPANPKPYKLARERFDEIGGTYAGLDQPNVIISFSREGDRYYAQAVGKPQFPMIPMSASEFQIPVLGARLTFANEASNTARGVTLQLPDGEHRMQILDRRPPALAMQDYAGMYASAELGAEYKGAKRVKP